MKITKYSGYESFINKNNLMNAVNVYNDKYGKTLYNLNNSVSFYELDKLPTSVFNYYQVVGTDNLYSVVQKQYDSIELVWLIAKINGITDMFQPLTIGTYLKFPKEDLISIIIGILQQ